MTKYFTYTLLGMSVIFLSGCGLTQQTGCSIDSGNTTCSTNDTGTIDKAHSGVVYGTFTNKQQLLGKPTFLRRAGKFCAYCRDKIQPVEQSIQSLGDSINIQMMTMNFETAPFQTTIPQSPYETFTYESFTQTSCDTFPTRVVLDATGNLISQECGGKTTIPEVAEQLKKLISSGSQVSDPFAMDHTSMGHGEMGMNHSNVTSEQQFLVDMIPHHQEAVDTSKIILSSASGNAQLINLLSGIITSQTNEIEMMKGRLAQRYTGSAMTSSYKEMMPNLTQLTGSTQIKAYLEGMIEHHQGAVQMAQSVLKLNPRSELKQFAGNIILVQQAEIQIMKGMINIIQ